MNPSNAPNKHQADVLGVWERPHPRPELAERGLTVKSTLYDRPPPETQPQSVIETYVNDEGKSMTREVPFQDPILGAGWECNGCGEPFGKQVKLGGRLFASLPASAYDTNIGRLYFCQDAYRCSRLAAERLGGKAASKIIERASDDFAATTQAVVASGARLAVCANPRCGLTFQPVGKNQRYHSAACRFECADKRTNAQKRTHKRKVPINAPPAVTGAAI